MRRPVFYHLRMGAILYDVICLIAHKRISGACPDYISELIELNSTLTAASIVEIHEAPILTYILPRRYEEGGWSHILCDNF